MGEKNLRAAYLPGLLHVSKVCILDQLEKPPVLILAELQRLQFAGPCYHEFEIQGGPAHRLLP